MTRIGNRPPSMPPDPVRPDQVQQETPPTSTPVPPDSQVAGVSQSVQFQDSMSQDGLAPGGLYDGLVGDTSGKSSTPGSPAPTGDGELQALLQSKMHNVQFRQPQPATPQAIPLIGQDLALAAQDNTPGIPTGMLNQISETSAEKLEQISEEASAAAEQVFESAGQASVESFDTLDTSLCSQDQIDLLESLETEGLDSHELGDKCEQLAQDLVALSSGDEEAMAAIDDIIQQSTLNVIRETMMNWFMTEAAKTLNPDNAFPMPMRNLGEIPSVQLGMQLSKLVQE